jgi:hypothetical protein
MKEKGKKNVTHFEDFSKENVEDILSFSMFHYTLIVRE